MPSRFKNYYHSMDRDYHAEPLMPIKDIGFSKMITKDALQPLVSAIRAGASKVELGFMGQGKGSIFAGQLTPESLGYHERRAIKELAKVNKVELSTHATIGISGISGMDRQGNFSEEAREQTLSEIRKAIDFAADTAESGAVVFHTSEFATAIGYDYGKEFAQYPGQHETESTVQFVDTRTGKNLGGMKRSDPVQIPKYNEEKEDWEMRTLDWEQVKKEAQEDKKTPEQFLIDVFREQQLRQKEDRIRDIHSNMDITRSHLSGAKREGDKDMQGIYEERLKGAKRSLKQAEQERDDEELSWKRGDIKPIQEYAVDQSAKSIAEVGIYAYDRSVDIKAKKPIFVAPENLFPGQYGAHPKELKDLILKARDKMEELILTPTITKKIPFGGTDKEHKMRNPLYRPDISKEEAHKLAQDHIKSTFDIGHAYLWRKHFIAEKGESREATDKRFNKWLMKEVEELKKADIIGHIHISDNMGYADEHLTPGMGKVPITEFVKKMMENGEKLDLVVEPGAQDPGKQYQALYGGWRLFGHSIYGPDKTFADVSCERADSGPTYWGGRTSPNFMYGENLPSNEYRGSPFWSGLGLE